MESTRLVTIIFTNRISDEEIPLFRGAVIQTFNGIENSLFHNHQNEKLRHSYPLVQYKRVNGYAAIMGIDEGADIVEQLSACNSFNCQLGYRKMNMKISAIHSEKTVISPCDTIQRYKIHRWLPLNSGNYQEYQTMRGLGDRINILEKVLIGNILSFTKGINQYIKSPLTCELVQLEDVGTITYKGVGLMCFNAHFETNMLLPEFIGLGKSASINHGMITHL